MRIGPRTKKLMFLLAAFVYACDSGNERKPKKMIVEFVRSHELEGYPSGSTISYYQDRLYLMGDDAHSMMILDTGFIVLEEIQLFENDAVRIKKAMKADIESSEWIVTNNKPELWLFGSGSLSPQRDSAFCYDPGTKDIERVDLSVFYQNLRDTGIPELNIEAAVRINDLLLFGSRGNLTHPQNYLLITTAVNFHKGEAPRKMLLNLPDGAGISGMTYLPERDILLLTSSKESTATAYDDGEIGESNLGIIYNISSKLSGQEVQPDEWIDLSGVHPDFNVQKIESICTLESENGEIKAVLVSDDDKGLTRLFEIKLKL